MFDRIIDRIIIGVIAGALAIFPMIASAQSSVPGFPPGTFQSRGAIDASSGGGSPTIVPGANVAIRNNSFAAGAVSFTGLNGGVNFPSGALVLVALGHDQSGFTYSPVTIGGQAATLVAGTQETNAKCQIFQAVMPSAEPDTFSVTSSGAGLFNIMGISSAYMTGLSSSTVSAAGNETFAANNDPQQMSTSPTVPSSGFGFAFTWFANNSAGATPTGMTWINTTSGTGDNFAALTGAYAVGSAHTATAGAWIPKASGVTQSFGFAACMSGGTWH